MVFEVSYEKVAGSCRVGDEAEGKEPEWRETGQTCVLASNPVGQDHEGEAGLKQKPLHSVCF